MGTQGDKWLAARRSLPALAASLALAAATCGCLPPPRMRLSEGIARSPVSGVWWSATRGQGNRSPIAGIEQRLTVARVRQWLIDDRGVRCFEYQGRASAGWGPPLATGVVDGDFAVIRSLVRARFGAADEPGWPGPPLPAQRVNRLAGTDDLIALLDDLWPTARTNPPADMTPHQIGQAMGAARVSVDDLLHGGLQ